MLLNAHGTGALTHDGDGLGVTAEGGDVVLNPLDGGHLVIEAVVAGEAGLLPKLRQAEKAHGSQAVVEAHGDDTLGGPHGAVKVLLMAAAAGKTAAMDVHQNGQFVALTGISGRPDIQKQAVLAVGVGFTLAELIVVEDLLEVLFLVIEGAGLIGAVAVPGGIIDAFPAGHLFGVFPTAGCGITDALVGGNAGETALTALQRAAGGIYDIIHIVYLVMRNRHPCRGSGPYRP